MREREFGKNIKIPSVLEKADERTKKFFSSLFSQTPQEISADLFRKTNEHASRLFERDEKIFATNYSDLLLGKKELVAPLLKEQVIIDLGGGIRPKAMVSLAREAESTAYVDVEYRLRKKSDIEFYSPDEIGQPEKIGKTEIFAVGDDMLHFLLRVKDNSVSIVMNGIDIIILPDEKYQKALVDEIIRVTKEGGAVVGFNSFVSDYLTDNSLFESKVTNEDSQYGGMFAFIKKPS